MSLVSITGWLTLTAIVYLYTALKLTEWSLATERYGVVQDYTDQSGTEREAILSRLTNVVQMIVGVIFLLAVWPGLESWSRDAWHYVIQVL